MRVTLLAGLVFAAGAWGQIDPCSLKCGETMAGCAGRCESDRRCNERCARHMDSCQERCVAAGRVPSKPKNIPKMCPGMNGKQIPCAQLTEQRPVPKPKEESEEEIIRQATKEMKGQSQPP